MQDNQDGNQEPNADVQPVDNNQSDNSNNEPSGNDKKSEDLLNELKRTKQKLSKLGEFVGLGEKGFSIDDIDTHLTKKKAEIEAEKRKNMTSEQLLREELEKVSETVKGLVKEKEELEKKASYESTKSIVQNKLLELGAMDNRISSITKLALVEYDGITDPETFVKGFKESNLDLFKSNVKGGAELGSPSVKNPNEYTRKVYKPFGAKLKGK